MSEKSQVTGGISFGGLLTILFIVLKITGVITWSWFWVLAPSLIPVLLLGAIVFVAFIVGMVKS